MEGSDKEPVGLGFKALLWLKIWGVLIVIGLIFNPTFPEDSFSGRFAETAGYTLGTVGPAFLFVTLLGLFVPLDRKSYTITAALFAAGLFLMALRGAAQ